MRSVVCLGGRFVAADRARVSVFDRGFLFGDAVFEAIRAYHGEPFALREHLERLRLGARALGFAAPWTERRWRETIRELLRRNRRLERDVAVRITLTRGIDGNRLLPARGTKPTIVISFRELDPSVRRLRRTGARVMIVPFHPGIGGLLGAVKTTDYATAIIAKRMAHRAGAFEALYRAPDGTLSEGATSNLFVVRRGRLLTPPLGYGILPGVTRRLVLSLARRAGVPTEERRLKVDDLLRADEAFLTATTIEVLPIRSVGGRAVGGADRPLTRRVQKLFCASHPPGDCSDEF